MAGFEARPLHPGVVGGRLISRVPFRFDGGKTTDPGRGALLAVHSGISLTATLTHARACRERRAGMRVTGWGPAHLPATFPRDPLALTSALPARLPDRGHLDPSHALGS